MKGGDEVDANCEYNRSKELSKMVELRDLVARTSSGALYTDDLALKMVSSKVKPTASVLDHEAPLTKLP